MGEDKKEEIVEQWKTNMVEQTDNCVLSWQINTNPVLPSHKTSSSGTVCNGISERNQPEVSCSGSEDTEDEEEMEEGELEDDEEDECSKWAPRPGTLGEL